MAVIMVCVATLLAVSTFGAEPVADRILKHFTSDNYTVTWGTAVACKPNADLEIGDGAGHGGPLRWMRFRPRRDAVEVLSIELGRGWREYESKCPLDNGSVSVKHAQMGRDAYAALLRDLAVVGSAELTRIKRLSGHLSTADFWVYARVTSNDEKPIDLEWAGYEGSLGEADYAQPRAAVRLAREAVKGLDFTEHALTEEERAWASMKFARDWKRIESRQFYWWVRERYIVMIGIVGDSAALPTLRGILEANAHERCTRYAINAVTRLTKRDVRDITEGVVDLENTRGRVLDLLADEVEKKTPPDSKGTPNNRMKASGGKVGCQW